MRESDVSDVPKQGRVSALPRLDVLDAKVVSIFDHPLTHDALIQVQLLS
jgi:hypothetical protein